jgi:protein-S-isoprenylcysteine O-methyltransferase Ste14
MVVGVIPATILYTNRPVSIGGALSLPWNAALALAGATGIGLGAWAMAATLSLFHRVGRGTLAPWDPPRRLVIRGIYRHVRNPMISGVLSVLLGEAAFFGSFPLAVWFVLFFGINMIYLPLFEEPDLGRRFGADYQRYKTNVPRWIPRVRPWRDPG